MAARQGTLAAGAARASGERAKRRSTPLIGAEPIVPADPPGTPDAVPAPGGTVVFHRYTTADCTGTATDQRVALTPGNPSTAVSDNFAAIANMSYRADYLGDASYPAATPESA